MNKTDAKLILGSGLSETSKMPCYSFNLSALDCKTGSKLVGVKNSVCEGCYALGGNYQRYKLPLKMQPKTEKINDPNKGKYFEQGWGYTKNKNAIMSMYNYLTSLETP